jgi:hypothetical protein
MAEMSSRFWLGHDSDLRREEAAALVATLAWRGIGGHPVADDSVS